MSEETVYKAEVRKLGAGSSLLPAVLLIGAGLLLLAGNVFRLHLMNFLWPGFIMGAGLLLLWPAHQSTKERQSSFAFLAVPGAMLLVLGLLFFFMNLVNHFESMAYAWTLVLAAAAGGLMYMNRFNESSHVHERGHRFIRAMILTFMALAIIFEVVAFGSLGQWWPLLLIGFGVYLFVKNRKQFGVEKNG